MTLNWQASDYFSLLLHRDKRADAGLEMLVDDLHADKERTISRFLCHSGSEDFLWGLVRLLGNTDSRVAGNAAYIIGTLAESELGCYRVISLTSSPSREGTRILLNLTNMLTFDDSESVMNAAGTMGTLAESHEGRMWMLSESCIETTLTHVTALLTNDNLWTASNAALVLARLTIAEEGCKKLLAHKEADHILSRLVNSLGVDEAGRGMNAAFAIGRLCDLECGRSRLLTLPESEKMISALARMLCCSDTGASKNACFALSCLATNKDGHTRLLKNAHSEEVLKTLAELLSAEDTETGWFAAMTLRTLANQPKGCLRLRGHQAIIPALKAIEGHPEVNQDLQEEVAQALEILKKLDKSLTPTAEVLGPNEVRVMWTEMTTKSGFTVRYHLFEDGKCVYQGRELSFNMRDLLPFTQYSFCVRAVTDGDEGPLSEPVTITTEEDVPSPVCNLRILGVTTTQLKVGWDPPEENNGVLRGYTVYVGGKNSEHTNDNSHILTGLTPSTNYEVQVCAATTKGKGPRESVSGMTSELGAHAPSKPEVVVRGRNELHITWRPPEVPLGRISRYDLLMDGEAIYSGTELHYTVHRLRPDREYAFQVVAITNEGRCESKTTKRRTAKDGFEGDRAPLYQPPVKKDAEPDPPKPVQLQKKRRSTGSITSSSNPDAVTAKSASTRCKSASSVKSRRREKTSVGELHSDVVVPRRCSSDVVQQSREIEAIDKRKDSIPTLDSEQLEHAPAPCPPWEFTLRSYNPEQLQHARAPSFSARSRSSRTSETSEMSLSRSTTCVAKEMLPKPKKYDTLAKPKGPSRNPPKRSNTFSGQNDNGHFRKSVARTKLTENSDLSYELGSTEKRTPRAIANVTRELLDQGWAKNKGNTNQHASGLSRDPAVDLERQLDSRKSTSEPDSKWLMQSSRADQAQDLPHTFTSLQLTTYRDHYKPSASQGGARTGLIELDTMLPLPTKSAPLPPAHIQRANTIVTAHRPGIKKQLEKLSGSRALPSSQQWRPELPSNLQAERPLNKFVPMQLRTQPANLPSGIHRQATNLNVEKAQPTLPFDLLQRQRTDIDLRNPLYMYGPSYQGDKERSLTLPANHSIHRDSRVPRSRSSVSLTSEPSVSVAPSNPLPSTGRHTTGGGPQKLGTLALSHPATAETKMQSAR